MTIQQINQILNRWLCVATFMAVSSMMVYLCCFRPGLNPPPEGYPLSHADVLHHNGYAEDLQ